MIKSNQPLRYPGQYYDAETGLHFNWHRYYDPDIGRYISADPLGLAGGINLFAYVNGNPVNAVDPMGLAIGVDDLFIWGPLIAVGGMIAQQSIENSDSGTTDRAKDSTDDTCNQCSEYQLIYEDNPKHGAGRRLNARGQWVSRRPSDGAYALSISSPVGPRQRVAYDYAHNEIVILPEHRTDEQNCIKYYHGYVADKMSDLRGRRDIINTIKDNGWPLPPK